MKKILCMLLCVVMITAIFAGCNKQPGNDTISTQTLPTEKPEENKYPIVDTPITIKGLHVAGAYDPANDGRIVWDKIAEITNVKVEWIEVEADALATYLAASDWEFDFIHMKQTTSEMISDYGVVGGKFANYYDLIQYMPNLWQTFQDYPEAEKAVKETNGAIYRLPHIEISATMTQVRPYYRTDVLAAAGLEAPKTVDEFYNALKVLKEKNGAPGWIPLGLNEQNYMGSALYSAFGTAVTADFDADDNGKVVYNRTSDQYRHYLTFLNKLYEEELIDQEFLTVDYQYVLAAAKAGTAAFMSSEAHSLTAEDFASGKFDISCLAPMTSQYDSTQTYLAQLPIALNSFMLNTESKYLVEMAKAFDIMFATEEVVEGSGLLGQSFLYGLEGTHYVLNEDGTYEQVVPAGVEGSFTDFQYNDLILENCGRADRLEGYITSTPGNGQARQIAFRDFIFPYACPNSEVFPEAFLKFTADEQAVLAGKFTDVKAYMNEMKSKFITGVVDIETGWDEYIKGLEARGLADVIEVYQAAYDRWNA